MFIMTPSFFKTFFVFTFLKIIFCHDTSNTMSPTSVYNNRNSKTESVTSFYSTYSESKSETPRYYPTDSTSKSSSLSYDTRNSKPNTSPTSYPSTDFRRKSTWAYNTDNTKESDANSSIPARFTSSVSMLNNSRNKKDPSLAVCPRIALKRGDYIIFSNGTLQVEILGLTLNSSYYIQLGDTVKFCETGRVESYWNAAHFLLSAFVIQAFTISISPTYIRIISKKHLVRTLIFLFFSNFALQVVRKINSQTLHLWFLLPYALYLVTVIIAAWLTLMVFDFIVLAIKIFSVRIYSNKVSIIDRANRTICLLLVIIALVTMATSFYDIISIYHSCPGYVDKAIACLDKSLPAFTSVLIMTFSGVVGCIFREVASEKYADDFILDFSKSNVVFLRKYFAFVSVGIFIAGAMIYKKVFMSLILSCVVVGFGYRDRDFTEEKLSFFNYILIDDVSKPVKNNIHV